jgi:glycosyltransferase involved in cell wall biosynthesis
MDINNHNPRDSINCTAKPGKIETVPAGSLNGLTLFRFAHIWRSANSGGVEAYLYNLNRLLLERNAMRILQMYLVQESSQCRVEVEKVDQGEIVWIPSILRVDLGARRILGKRIWEKFRGRQRIECSLDHDMLLSTLANYQPTLGVFHWISEDSPTIINYLNSRGVPLLVVHHFHNKKFRERMVRSQISSTLAVAGVSEVDLPGFLTGRFTNISDGIDINFFHPRSALPLDVKIDDPVIFLPARICEEKGHLDAVRALGLLVRSGVNAVLAFAGYKGSQDFTNKLKRIILEEGVQEKVIFVGELRPEDLRDWYAACKIVVLPTYHSEGLPRVLLEAQAMERPVLAYDSGGTREAFRDGVSGKLLKTGDIHGLSRWIQHLLEEEDSRIAMGNKGRELVVSRFSLDSLVVRHEAFYASALNSINR